MQISPMKGPRRSPKHISRMGPTQPQLWDPYFSAHTIEEEDEDRPHQALNQKTLVGQHKILQD